MESIPYCKLINELQNCPFITLTKVSNKKSVQYLYEFILTKLQCEIEPKSTALHNDIWNFCRQFERRYNKCGRKLDVVQSSKWAENNFDCRPFLRPHRDCGRPSKPFEDCGEKTKKARVQFLVNTVPTEQLLYAGKCSLLTEQKRAAASVVAEVIKPSFLDNAVKMKRKLQETSDKSEPMTPDEALALFMNTKLTRSQYNMIRSEINKRCKIQIFPSYKKLQEVKKICYPDNIQITEEGKAQT